ncbi:MAG: hemerythrin domain-containing protein [Kofleriaceae bacterium]
MSSTKSLFAVIRESHVLQRRWCEKLLRHDGAESVREQLFLQLKVELAAHAAAEERFLYVPLLMTDPGLDVSRHALSEHHDIDELCEDLSVRKKAGARWLKIARDLSEKVHHHLEEEESKFFKVGGRILSGRKKASLARSYQRELVRMRRAYAAEYALVGVDADGDVRRAGRSARSRGSS